MPVPQVIHSPPLPQPVHSNVAYDSKRTAIGYPAQGNPHDLHQGQMSHIPSQGLELELGSIKNHYPVSPHPNQPHYSTPTIIDPLSKIDSTIPMVKKTTTVRVIRYETLESYKANTSSAENGGRGTTANLDTRNAAAPSPSLRVSILDH